MSIVLFLLLLASLMGGSLLIAARASKGVQAGTDYLLANRRLGVWSLCLSVMATQIGAGLVLGSAEAAYRSGWPVILWPWGNALGLLVLGLGLAGKLRGLGIRSVAELFETVYGSRGLRKFASILSVLALFFILVAQLIGLRKFLCATGLGGTPLYLGVGTAVMAYTALGGLRAVVFTDVLQALFIGLVFGAVAMVIAPEGIPAASVTSFDGGVWSTLSGWFVAPFLFMLIGQDMGQRCFAGKSGRTVNVAFICAALGVAAIGFVPVWLAILASQMGMAIPEGSSVLLTAASALGGPFITTAVAVAVVIALLSTIDSLVCAVSCNVAVDFGLGARRLGVLQAVSLVIGLLALGMGLLFSDVGVVMLTSYELAVACLAVPVLAGLIPRIRSKRGALFAVIGGGIGFILFRLLPVELPREVCSLAMSLLAYGIGWWTSRSRVKAVALEVP
jgi:solute:Na+ symporter, SSS family